MERYLQESCGNIQACINALNEMKSLAILLSKQKNCLGQKDLAVSNFATSLCFSVHQVASKMNTPLKHLPRSDTVVWHRYHFNVSILARKLPDVWYMLDVQNFMAITTSWLTISNGLFWIIFGFCLNAGSQRMMKVNKQSPFKKMNRLFAHCHAGFRQYISSILERCIYIS